MSNLIVIFFNHFSCMYVGLVVRDECERSVKNQVSNDESVEFATRPCVEHMTGR